MLRVGKIAYTNILPIYYFFNEESFGGEIKLISQIPAQLNREMSLGRIDVGPISSFSYAENEQKYVAMPNLSVSCRGKVRSIYLFSKKPIDALDGCSIALTKSSATSVALLKIILQQFYQHENKYAVMKPELSSMMQEHDAALLIGDDALLAFWQNKEYPYIYDLGEEWYKHTGLSITFAVWAVRRESVIQHSPLLTRLYDELLRSKEHGMNQLHLIVNELCQKFGGNPIIWREYFSGLSYTFDEEEQKGLHYFFKLAYEENLLPSLPTIKLWEPERALL